MLLTAELREIARIGQPDAGLPEHLRGIPACLHRYEPLLLDAWRDDAGVHPTGRA